MEPKTLPEFWSYSRKAAFHFGWDWGPRLVTYGLYKPVSLRGFSKARILTTHFRNEDINNYQNLPSIKIFGHVDLAIAANEDYKLQIILDHAKVFELLSPAQT